MNGIEELYNIDIADEIVAAMPLQVELALKMIPEFNGDKQNLHRFICCCDIVAQTCTTQANHATLLNVIKRKLSGSAYDIIKYKTFEDWASLKIILQSQYLEKRTIAQIQTELLSAVQLPNEGVQFANRVKRLNIDLNDASIASEGLAAAVPIQNLNSKLALRASTEGLKPSLKLLIKASRFDTLTAAVAAACEEERIQNFKKPIPNQSHSQNFRSKDIKCYTCGRNNHTAAQCRFKNNSHFTQYPINNVKFQNPVKERQTFIQFLADIAKK